MSASVASTFPLAMFSDDQVPGSSVKYRYKGLPFLSKERK